MVKEKSEKHIVNLYIGVLFAAFFIYQLLQHSMVFLYHDDYGYASLQYGVQIGTGGMDYEIKEIFSYLRWHYLNWGGRVISFFLEILCLRLGGLTLIRIVQSAVITAISYETYLMARGKSKDSFLLALSTALIWGTLTIRTLREGVYWFTASVLYVWPLFFLFAGIIVRRGIVNIRGKLWRMVIMFILFFMAGFSQEQVAVMTVMYCALDILVCVILKQKREYVCLVGAVTGSALELFAPGNFVRAGTKENLTFMNMSIIDKIFHNAGSIINILFGPQNILFCVVIGVTVLLTGILIRKKSDIKNNFFSVGILLLGFTYPFIRIVCMLKGFSEPWLNVLMAIWAVSAFLWLLWYFFRDKNFNCLCLLSSAICSQMVLLVSPALNQRSAALFQLVFHCIVLSVFMEFLICFMALRFNKYLFGALYLFFAASCILNIMKIGRGYYRNAGINEKNHSILSEASLRRENGETVEKIVLYKLYDDAYAEDMPYNKQYIEYWIRGYYNLPAEVIFDYEEAWKRSRG